MKPGTILTLPGGQKIKLDAPGAPLGTGKGNMGRGGGEGRMASKWVPLK